MNMTTVPSNKLKEMQQQLAEKDVEIAALKEQVNALEDKAVILRATIKAQEHWQEQVVKQAAVIEQMREAFRVASMDTETINRKAPEIAKGCCSMPMPDTEGTYHLANEEVCNVVSSYLYWLHKNQPTALQPSPEILQARDERVAEAITKYLRAVGVLSYEGTALQGIISGEWRKYL